jgi:RNA recognition motif-containing protein
VGIEANNQSSVSSSTTGHENRDGIARALRPHRSTDGSELAPTRQLFVANMLYEVTAEDLKVEMEKFGEVLSSRIAMQNGRSRGSVFPFGTFSRWSLKRLENH